jgi:hypothetical protein
MAFFENYQQRRAELQSREAARKMLEEFQREGVHLLDSVARNMPNGEFRSELRKLVRQFEGKPSGV